MKLVAGPGGVGILPKWKSLRNRIDYKTYVRSRATKVFHGANDTVLVQSLSYLLRYISGKEALKGT